MTFALSDWLVAAAVSLCLWLLVIATTGCEEAARMDDPARHAALVSCGGYACLYSARDPANGATCWWLNSGEAPFCLRDEPDGGR